MPLFYLAKDWGRWISLIFIIFSVLFINTEREDYFSNKYLMLLLIMNITFYMNPSCCDVNVLVISDEISKYIEEKNLLRDNLRAIDMNIYLYTNILPKVDIASMSNSLEVRPPYLDERIVNFAYHELKSNHVGYLNTKKYLRDFIEGTELNFINKMNRKGLGFPVFDWLTNYGLEEMKELFIDQKLIYLEEDHDHLFKLLFKSNLSSNTSRELWAYYVLTKWFLEINNFSK